MITIKEICKDLFFVFAKIGAFTFGGGYAMISLIKKEVVEEKKWLDKNEISDIIAISESTPGPFAINVATFVGSKMAGIKGALIATLGMVLPSFFIILFLSQLLLKIENYEFMQNIFVGIRATVLILIGNALFSLFRQMNKDVFSIFLMLFAFSFCCLMKINTVYILMLCGLLGVLHSYKIGKNNERQTK